MNNYTEPTNEEYLDWLNDSDENDAYEVLMNAIDGQDEQPTRDACRDLLVILQLSIEWLSREPDIKVAIAAMGFLLHIESIHCNLSPRDWATKNAVSYGTLYRAMRSYSSFAGIPNSKL